MALGYQVSQWVLETVVSGGVMPPAPTVSCNNPPAGVVTVPYSHVLTASGGTPPYTFSISAGALPPGLALAADGTISGTPTLAGVFPFTVLVTDSAAQTGTVDCSISISAGTIRITLRGVKIRGKCAPDDLEALPELPSVDRAI